MIKKRISWQATNLHSKQKGAFSFRHQLFKNRQLFKWSIPYSKYLQKIPFFTPFHVNFNPRNILILKDPQIQGHSILHTKIQSL